MTENQKYNRKYIGRETLEEVAKRYILNTINAFGDYQSFIAGYKLAQERSYSEEDMKTAFREGFVKSYDDTSANSIYKREEYLTKWFEQFKKK